MARKLTTLATTLFAALVVAGVFSPYAAAVEFFSESENTDLTFLPDTAALQVFEFGGTTVECAELSLTGGWTGSKKTESLWGRGNFTECEFLGEEAEMKMGNCGFTFNDNNTIDLINVEETNCAAKPMTIKAKTFGGTECDVKIENQNGITGVSYSTMGLGVNREITITLKAENIKYTTTSKNGGCVPGFQEDGKWEGKVRVTGWDLLLEKMIGVFTEP